MRTCVVARCVSFLGFLVCDAHAAELGIDVVSLTVEDDIAVVFAAADDLADGGVEAALNGAREEVGLGAHRSVAALEVAGASKAAVAREARAGGCLLYTSPSPRDQRGSRMPSSA